MEDKIIRLKMVADNAAQCTNCILSKTRINSIFSRGNPEARLMIVGEAGGRDEHVQGKPFVGRSGKLLDSVLTELGLDVSKDVYITNICKCWPPDNRKPSEEECNSCFPFLEEEIRIINPKVILALGATAADNLLPTTYSVSKIRGQLFRKNDMFLCASWHPSYVLRNGSSGQVYEDFKNDLRTAINKVRSTEQMCPVDGP